MAGTELDPHSATPPLSPDAGPRLRVPKASDLLAEELATRISTGELAEGTALPPERVLVEQTMLSRTSVREALRILELRGFVEIRPGRGGGAFVRRPTGHQLATSALLVVRGTHVSLASLLLTRAAVEPTCAGLAALRRTPADLGALEEADGAMRAACDVATFLQANVDWHMAVARASCNELLAGLMEALAGLIYDATGHAGTVDAQVRTETCRAHRAITAAVRTGDRELARHRMQRHVEAYLAAVVDDTVGRLDWARAAGQ
ncbi:MAG TPA: FCD domain-containing protein [Nocardioides sp.]|nr:FCD domain-containing protein [Nocardioides sp.]